MQGFLIGRKNVSTMRETNFRQLPAELKYCEFCGALWLRPCGSADVYCTRCAEWIERELPGMARGEA